MLHEELNNEIERLFEGRQYEPAYPSLAVSKIHNRDDWWYVRTYVGKRIFFAYATTRQAAVMDVIEQVRHVQSQKDSILSPFV